MSRLRAACFALLLARVDGERPEGMAAADGGDDGAPTPAAPAAHDSTLPPGAGGEAADEAAWQRLRELMATLRVEAPIGVLDEALRLRSATADGSSSRKALLLLQTLAAASNHTAVPQESSAAAAVELGHMHLRGEGVARDVRAAVAYYDRAAETGDPEAQHALGVVYATGLGAEQNAPLAATYLYFAAEGGAIGAQLALGYRHLLGVDAVQACQKSLLYYAPVAERVVASAQRLKGGGAIEKVRLSIANPTGAGKRGADDDVLHYYEHSASKGSVDAQLTLAHLHYHGARGLAADVAKAFEYYTSAAAAGEPSAYAHLGNMYAQGIGVEQDNTTALSLFAKGAAKGHASSLNGLGFMHMHGYGVAQNHNVAHDYFKAAADKGNAEAQFNLGAMHIGGMGVKKSYDKALTFFTTSAHQGHTLALYNLGQMHLNGLGTAKSCQTAVQFLKAVAERGPWGSVLEDAHAALQGPDAAAPVQLYAALAEGGYEVAQANLAFLLDQQYMHRPAAPLLGLRGEQIAARAMGMYRRAAQQGNVEAELRLGDYHYYGYGLARPDREAAVTHYRAAAESRSAQAMFNLAYMYAHGIGLARDHHLAKRHYDMAAETAAEAWAPVHLALLELQFLKWYAARTGGADPYEQARRLLGPLADGPTSPLGAALEALASSLAPSDAKLAHLEAGVEWDTLLILALSLMLAAVLYKRQRQTLDV